MQVRSSLLRYCVVVSLGLVATRPTRTGPGTRTGHRGHARGTGGAVELEVVVVSPRYLARAGLRDASAKDVRDQHRGGTTEAEPVAYLVDGEREDYEGGHSSEREPKLGRDEAGSRFGADEDAALLPP